MSHLALVKTSADGRSLAKLKMTLAALQCSLSSEPSSSFPLRKLRAYGLDEPCCLLLQDYLQGRLQRVKIGEATSEWMHNHRGIPQRSVLGPLLAI